jgi:DNA-binding response OmpR family regulator
MAYHGGVTVLAVTVSATYDRVAELNVGADDFLTKSFEMEKILARINALLILSRSAV